MSSSFRKYAEGKELNYLHIMYFLNPLKGKLDPFCHFLALLAHHILHVSRVRVKVVMVSVHVAREVNRMLEKFSGRNEKNTDWYV
jgi:hypothetical protein